MKKLIFITLFCFALFGAKAQTPKVQLDDGDVTPDTLSANGTTNLTYEFTGDYDRISFQLILTKVSGTVAGTCPLHASDDGVNYFPINTLNYAGGAVFTDTVTITDVATQTFTWTERPARYRYYRLPVTRSNGVFIMKAWGQARKSCD